MPTNVNLFDRFSIPHAGLGVVAGSMGMGVLPLLAYHTIWEIVENYYLKKKFGYLFPDSSADTMVNMIGDTICAVAGWSLNLKDRVKDDPYVGNWTIPMLWEGWKTTNSSV